MKTTAFLIRVTICLLLSLIPATELENRIYATRMELKSYWVGTPRFVIVDIDAGSFSSPKFLEMIRQEVSSQKPALVLTNLTNHWNFLLIDADGTVRRATLHAKEGPSLTWTAYAQLNMDLKALKRVKDPHLINYIGPSGTFPHCSIPSTISIVNLSTMLAKVCPSLEGRIVLLTEDSDSLPTFHTPLGEMSPAEIVANDIHTIIHHEPLYQVSTLLRIMITLGMILIAALYIVYYPVLISAIAIIATGIVIVILFFQFIFQVFDIYIPSANIISALLITYLIFTGYRLALQENLQWRSLKQAQYLRELDRMKSNFLSLVSHDLKTPLAKIQAVSERLRRELQLPLEERSDWRELIDSIENSNSEMKHYITSILNLSRIESQKVILNKKSNDINILIQQALKRLKPLAQQKNIQVEESLEPLFSIECDEDLMRQVLTNLIDNAIKYSPSQSKIIVRSHEEEGFVRVEVEDFGPGIPKDQLPLMFRKFSRLIRPMKEQVKGTGLGLYLSKYFIELHGGTIRVKSTEGQGTTFSFTLPLNGAESSTLLG